MDERQAVYDQAADEQDGEIGKISEAEQFVRSALIVGCALGVLLGLVFAGMMMP